MHINNTDTFIKNFYTAKGNKILWSKIILVVQTGLFWNCILSFHEKKFLVFQFFCPSWFAVFLTFYAFLYLVGYQFKVLVRWNIKRSFLFLIKWKFLKRDFFSYISQALWVCGCLFGYRTTKQRPGTKGRAQNEEEGLKQTIMDWEIFFHEEQKGGNLKV